MTITGQVSIAQLCVCLGGVCVCVCVCVEDQDCSLMLVSGACMQLRCFIK